MDEAQLQKRIKLLETIKPNKDWVILTKKNILGESDDGLRELNAKAIGMSERVGFFNAFGFLVKKKSFALVLGSVIFGVLFFGTIFFVTHQNGSKTNLVFQEQDSQEKAVLASLDDIQKRLKDVSLELGDLNNIKDKNKALAVIEVVKATAKQAEKSVEGIEKTHSELSGKILASLNKTKEATHNLYLKSDDSGKKIMKDCLDDLSNRTLTEDKQKTLNQAKDFYNKGEYQRALLLIQSIYNNK